MMTTVPEISSLEDQSARETARGNDALLETLRSADSALAVWHALSKLPHGLLDESLTAELTLQSSLDAIHKAAIAVFEQYTRDDWGHLCLQARSECQTILDQMDMFEEEINRAESFEDIDLERKFDVYVCHPQLPGGTETHRLQKHLIGKFDGHAFGHRPSDWKTILLEDITTVRNVFSAEMEKYPPDPIVLID